jgi:hypothetical protein
VSDGTVYLAATSAGFFATDTLMGVNTKWVQQASGEIGNMVCDMFDVRTSDGTIGLATHGNGIYSAKIVKKGDILGADYIKRNQNAQISVYPNPSSKMITVDVQLKFISQFVDLTVMDALGRIVPAPIKELDSQNGVDAKSFLKKLWTVDISALKSGVYYVRMKSEGVVKTAQIQVL